MLGGCFLCCSLAPNLCSVHRSLLALLCCSCSAASVSGSRLGDQDADNGDNDTSNADDAHNVWPPSGCDPPALTNKRNLHIYVLFEGLFSERASPPSPPWNRTTAHIWQFAVCCGN